MSSESKLKHLRQELDILNLRFMELVDQRFEIVKEVEKIKSESDSDMWSPDREIKLFQKYVELTPHADLRFDSMYSLLIETQASKVGNYPEWSKKSHLNSESGTLADYVNPILLFARDKAKWMALDFKSEYLEKMQKVMNVDN